MNSNDANLSVLDRATGKQLRTLQCSRNNISPAVARDVVLPAVRANTSLRQLEIESKLRIVELVQAEALVRSRGGA